MAANARLAPAPLRIDPDALEKIFSRHAKSLADLNIMPNLFRTLGGKVWKASAAVSLALADGTAVDEKWLSKAGRQRARD
jgi:hypothetical protein